MDNFSEEDFQMADRIIQGMFGETDNLFVEEYISIADIEQDVEAFKRDLDFLSHANLEVPAVYIGGEINGLIPVSLNYYLKTLGLDGGFSNLPGYYPYWPEYRYIIRDLVNASMRKSEEKLSYENAQQTFEKWAKVFLANRIATINNYRKSREERDDYSLLNLFHRRGSARITTPGCNFKVTTDSPGLRVFWSGAYVISPKYFGSPTSPAISVLQSGNYIFGVDGGAYSNVIQWDHNAVVTLPGDPAVHLKF